MSDPRTPSQPDVERAAIVKFLRHDRRNGIASKLVYSPPCHSFAMRLADAIERGDHLSQQPSNGGGE